MGINTDNDQEKNGQQAGTHLLLDVWYVCAHSDELNDGRPLGRKIAGINMVFWRSSDSAVHAFNDACPHRLAPLSRGEIIAGKSLRCPYHGFSFDQNGQCDGVPGQDHVPDAWRVEKYPVVERYGCIWVWPGEPDKARDQSSLPEFMAFGEPPYQTFSGRISVAADYRLLMDNLLDPTHAEFIHRTSFGSGDLSVAQGDGRDVETTMEDFSADIRDDGISFIYRLINSRGGPCFREAFAMKSGSLADDENIDYVMTVDWQPPGLFSYAMDLNTASATNDEHGLRLVNLHILTPESEFSTHYFFRCSVLSKDGRGDIGAILDYWQRIDNLAFNEDKAIVEAQQELIGRRDLFEHRLISRHSDEMHIKGRKILRGLGS